MARILLVEDDRLIGTMVRMNLEQEGHEVDWREDGHTGKEAIESGDFDVMLLDITMPGPSGIELAQIARLRGLVTPIVMLTARDDTSTKVEALDSGADDYLAKPFDMAEMLARVRAQLRRAGGRSA